MNDITDAFKKVTRDVTKKWAKQRKAEDRGNRNRSSRVHIYSDRVAFTDAARKILPAGYLHASGNGKYTVDKRQFYYAVRDQFLKATGREITADYFSQTLLVQYMNRHPRETAHWKITASPRGTLTIPNTGEDTLTRIPCGTIAIEAHLRGAKKPIAPFDGLDKLFRVQWPSLAEGQRYQGVLYIEKEGFDPQLREARIAERFDIAIVSCKGQSVAAARRFVDHVCSVGGGVPLFVAHDLDKSGFEISQRLTTVSDHAVEKGLVKYWFQNEIDVTDLGLRLKDAEEYDLKTEYVEFNGHFADDSIATKEEREFLRSHRRVELNAFTAPQFIEWLVKKLSQYLPGRLIPDDKILTDAYRRALALVRINQAVEESSKKAIEEAQAAEIPNDLREKLVGMMVDNKEDSSEAWDAALYKMVKEQLPPKAG
jgi:hypothetical protein